MKYLKGLICFLAGSFFAFLVMQHNDQNYISPLKEKDIIIDDSLQMELPPIFAEKIVKDKETAVRIALAAWISEYGYDVLYDRLYRVTLVSDSIWVVRSVDKAGSYPIQCGGGEYAEICKDGRIIQIKGFK